MPLPPRLYGHTVSRPDHRSGHPCQPPRPAPRKRSATAPTKHAWGAGRPSLPSIAGGDRSARCSTAPCRTLWRPGLRCTMTALVVVFPVSLSGSFVATSNAAFLTACFARARCADCGHDFLVAYSSKGRGVCPSCTTRRMVEAATHFDLHVIPRLPVGQRVLSVPKRLRYHGSEGGRGLPSPAPIQAFQHDYDYQVGCHKNIALACKHVAHQQPSNIGRIFDGTTHLHDEHRQW